MIHELTIQNFKSIKELKLKPKRINLFVGKPNTGKSNILEALSLFSDLSKSYLNDFVRLEKLRHLFYDGDIHQEVNVEIKVQSGVCYTATLSAASDNSLEYHLTFGLETTPTSDFRHFELIQNDLRDDRGLILVSQDLPSKTGFGCKKYAFRKLDHARSDRSSKALQVPFGQNLFYVLETNPILFEKVAEIFDQYGLSLVLNQENDSILTQKKVGRRVFQLPYSLVADTLQRMVFYLAAINSNSESILIFEEPETHSFPPYITELAKTIAEAKSNQFFIATHSPYLFNTIIEETPKEEVAVFIADYEQYQTVVHQFPEEDYGEIADYGIDIFFNLRRAMKKDVEAT